MKILMVINCLRKGGRERRVLELVKSLSQKPGFSVCLVTLSDLIEYDYVHELPIRLEILKKKSDKDFSLIFRVRKIIRDFNPDVIHSWDVMSSGYLTAANMFLGKKIINGVIYDAATDSSRYDRHSFKIRLFSHLTKATVANSLAGLRAYNTPASKSICIYNGIDLKRFENLRPAAEVQREILGKEKSDEFVATMVASFTPWKDQETLITAGINLCRENPEFRLIFIGDGSELPAAKTRVKQAGLEEQVLFLGSRNDIESILQISDVGLLISPCEGLSNAIIEYMASGLPVIASKGGGTEELVKHGENGFLVEQKDHDGIATRLRTLMNDPELRTAMGKKGAQWIRDHFEVSRMTKEYLTLYQNVISKTPIIKSQQHAL